MDPVTAAVEVAGAAATVATEAAQAAGVVAKTAETVGEVAQGVGEAAKVVKVLPNPIAAAEVSKLAVEATESSDVLAGKGAIERLTQLSDNLGASKAETSHINTEFTTEQEAAVQVKIESNLQKWEQEHPKPDLKTNPEGYKKWCEDHWEAEIDHIANARTEISMREWDKKNPEPDKIKDPEKHKEWLDKRSKQESSLKEKIKKETKNLKESERAAIIAEINRLRQLYQERVDIIEGINALRRKPKLEQTDQDKIDLARFQVRKAEIDAQINVVEADLRAKAGSSPLYALLVASALASMMVYKAAKEEKVV